jgi:hypothetical protein
MFYRQLVTILAALRSENAVYDCLFAGDEILHYGQRPFEG